MGPGGQPELDLGAEAKRRPYTIPVEGVLKRRGTHDYGIVDEATRHAADVLTAALNEFNIQAEVTGIRKGPVITLFEVLPAPGVRVSKIANLADNIALRLAAPSVRIVAPIPGKHAVGIEVPNRERAIVELPGDGGPRPRCRTRATRSPSRSARTSSATRRSSTSSRPRTC